MGEADCWRIQRSTNAPLLAGTMLIEITLAAIALFGHAVLWVGVSNRLHAMPLKRSHIKAISTLSNLGMLAVPIVFVWWINRERPHPGEWRLVVERNPTALFYALLCIGMAAVHVPRWLYVRFIVLRDAAAHGRRLFVLDVTRRLGRHPTRGIQFALGRLAPFNQVMRIEFTEKEVPLSHLPLTLEGLRIAHLSDLHLSGRVEPEFYREVIREVEALEPDLVLLTGDICDTARCLSWIAEILSPLQPRYGKFYILGNHDQRLNNIPELRATVAAAGFVNLGGKVHQLEIDGASVLLAGNELPWFGPAPSNEDLPARSSARGLFKILLSHSPDQARWACRQGFELMLCGHTHGGQIRFPLVGPVVCPSWYGVRYSAGLFLERSMAVHVSRGVSGLFPVRWNCMPEVAMLVLRRR